jgi:hypothetical protein
MQNYYSITEFADVLRNKYPGQFDIFDDDNFLVRNLLLKYPDLSKRLNPDDLYEIFPEYKPMSVEMYEDYGESARAPFGTRFMHSSKSMLLDVVTTGGDLLGVDNIREWSKGIKNDWMRQDPSLQAYMLWREDEPVSRENFMDLDMIERGFGEMLPSYAAMFAAAGIATVASAPVGLVTLATIGTLEGTSEYVEARDILEKKGVPDNEAKLTSGLASLAYGIIAGYLERIPFFHAIRRFPGLKTEVGKKMHSRLMNAITNKVFSKGLGSQSFWARLASKGGVIGTEAIDGMFTEAVTEAAQGLSQNVINWGLENGWGDTPDEVMSNITKATREGLKDQELIEQAYGGAIGGGIFSGFGGAVGGAKRQKETIDYIDDFGETVAQKASDAAHGVPPTSAPAAPPVGDGEFTAPTFLESLAFDAPVYNYSTLAVDEDKAAAAAESTKDIESYQERAVKFIEEMGDPTLIDELSESARSNLLHGVGRWFKEEGILPADAKISTEKVRSMLDRIATGKAKIGTSIETAPGGDLVGVVKTLLADDIVKAKLESDIQFMMEDSQVNMADLNIGDMVVEEDPSITAVEGQIDVVTEEAVQAISDEQKADMLSVGDNVTIVGVDKHQGKSGEILKKTKKGVVLKVTLPDGKSKQITFPYKFIEPADIVTEKKSARDLIEDEIEIYNVKGEKYTAKVTARSEAGSIMVLNQEGEEVILDDDLTAVTQDVNSPTYQIQSAGLSATSQGEVVSEMSNEQLAEIESELAERLQKVAGSGQGAEQSAFMDLNAVKLAARKPAEERAEEEPPPRFFPKPGIGAMEKARAKDKAVPPLTLEDIDNELRPDPKRTVAAIVKAHEGEFTKSQAKSVYDSMRKRYAKFKKDPIAYLKAEIKQKEDGLKKGTYKKTNTKKYVQERLAQEKALLKNLEGAPTEKEEEPQETVIAEAPVEAKEGVSFDESGAMVIRQSPMSGKKHMMFIPGATEQQFRDWQEKGLHIQDAFPNLDAPEREFLLSGMTPTEWEAAFPPEPDETPYKVIDGPFKGAIVVTDEDGIVTAFDKPPDVGWNADMQEKDVIGQPLDFIGDPNELKEIGGTLEDVAARKAAEEEGDSPEFDKLPDPVEGSPTMTYTGVGSRDTPSDIRKQMNEVSKVLEKAGYTVNTGNAKGADAAFRYGVEKKNIFTPKDADDDTRKIAKEIHPLKEKLTKEKGLDLHARNTFQVFGKNLDTPVDFVLTWTKDGAVRDEDAPGSGNIRTIKTGGTGQAISLASLKGIPVINMANEGWQDQLIAVVGDQAGKAGKNALVELFKTTPMVAEDEEEDVTNVDEINDIKLDRSIAAAERYNKTGNLSMIIRGEIHDLTDEELKKMDEIEKAEGGIYKLGPKEVAQQLEFFQLKVTVFKRVTGESVRKDTPKAEKPLTPAGIKTKNFRTMTERKKEAAVQGDKSAQAEWAVEEVSEFYSAVEDGNISEIREEAMGLLRLAQHWPDNADVRLTVRKVIKDINKVFPTKESFNEAFDKWKAAKIKKGQAQEGVYVEDLKKTLEEIGQKTPPDKGESGKFGVMGEPAPKKKEVRLPEESWLKADIISFADSRNIKINKGANKASLVKAILKEVKLRTSGKKTVAGEAKKAVEEKKKITKVEALKRFKERLSGKREFPKRTKKDKDVMPIDKDKKRKKKDDDNTNSFVDVSHIRKKSRHSLKGNNIKETRKIRRVIFRRLRRKMPFIKPFEKGFVVNANELPVGIMGQSLGDLVRFANITPEGKEASLEIIPHEYFHAYWNLLGETSPLVRQAVKMFGTEAMEWAATEETGEYRNLDKFQAVGERLAQAVGQVYAHRAVREFNPKGQLLEKMKAWLVRFWRKLKAMVAPSKLTSDQVVTLIAEEFYEDAPMEIGVRPVSISKEVRKRYKHKYSKEKMKELKAGRSRRAANLFADENADFSSTIADEEERDYDDWASNSESEADWGYKRFLETGVSVWGVSMDRSEFLKMIDFAKSLHKSGFDVRSNRMRFMKYVTQGDWASKEKQIRILAENALREQRHRRPAAQHLRQVVNRLYTHAQDSIPRSDKVSFEVLDGEMTLQGDKESITGRKLSMFQRKSFIDETPLGDKTAYLKFSDINKTFTYTDSDGQDKTSYYNVGNQWVANRFDRLERDISKWVDSGGLDTPYSIVGVRGANQSTLILTEVSQEWVENSDNMEAISEYFEAEKKAGNVSQQDIDNWIVYAENQIVEWNNPIAYAQAISRHEWWKAAYGEQYLQESRKLRREDPESYKGIADEFSRTRSILAEGWRPYGWTGNKGTYDMVVIDPSEVEIRMVVDGVEKTISAEEDFLQIGKKRYRFDGFMPVDSRSMGKIAHAIGREPERGERLTEFKPYIYHVDGEGMIMEKMNMSEAPSGMQIINKETKAPIISVRGDTGRIEYVFHGPDGDVNIQAWASTEETKKSSGAYSQTNSVLTLPESSLRVISAGDESGKRSAPFPMTWMDLAISPDLLQDEDFRAGYKIVANHLVSHARKHISNLVKMRSDPARLREMLVELGAIKHKTTFTEFELIKAIDAAALLHPVYMKRHAPSIINSVIKQTAFKGRRDGQGSYIAMAPDFADHLGEDEIAYGDGNRTMVRLTAQEAYEDKDEFLDFWSRYRKKREREAAIAELNERLKTKNIEHLRGRQPVVDIPSLALRRVKFIEYDGGNRVFVNAIDTFKWLQGDFDGDHLMVESLPPKVKQGMKMMMNSDAYKSRVKSTRLDIFEHSKFKGVLSNFNDLTKVMENTSVAHASEGIINNFKSIREVLVFKNLKTQWKVMGKDVSIEVVPPAEMVIIDYAPLDKSIVSQLEVYKSLKDEGISVVDKDGKVYGPKKIAKADVPLYLKTTSAHEASILLQAAVDNVKEMLLPHWGYNGYSFLVDRILRRSDGKELSTMMKEIYIKDIFGAFKYSPLRRGREMGRGQRSLNMMEMYGYSQNFHNYNTATDKNKSTLDRAVMRGGIKEKSMDYTVARARTEREGQKLEGLTVDAYNEQAGMETRTVFENIMPILYEEIQKHEAAYPLDTISEGDIFALTRDHTANAHIAAINEFNEVAPAEAAKIGLKIAQENVTEGRKFADKMVSDYLNIFANEEFQDEHGNTFPLRDRFITKYEYSEAIGAFIEKWLPKFRALSPETRWMATQRHFDGVMLRVGQKKGKTRKRDIKDIENVVMLLPFELMEKEAAILYFNSWGKNLFEVPTRDELIEKEKMSFEVRTVQYEKELQKRVCKK